MAALATSRREQSDSEKEIVCVCVLHLVMTTLTILFTASVQFEEGNELVQVMVTLYK